MDSRIEKQVGNYVRTNYKRLYGDSPNLTITATDAYFSITDHKDGSPLILSKKILSNG
tara:strand:- start:68 stop:241 length:174 start_codon:yes stop_codon:yes gene_type:complete